MPNVATFVKDVSSKFRGRAEVFKVVPPVPWGDNYDTERYTHKTTYIVVSAATVMFSGPETYIFPCDANGNVKDWGELAGSRQGHLNIDRAIKDAGYEVVR